MNQTDLTPPTKKAPPPPTQKAGDGSAPSKPKAEKAPVDPNAPKKPRQPRADYGFTPDSTIHIVKDKDNKYRGQRLEWFNKIKEFEGKKVSEFMTKYEGNKNSKGANEPPRGWIRFFVQDGTVTLTKSVAANPAA